MRDIYYVESRGHQLIYHTRTGDHAAAGGTIQQAEEDLKTHGFFRSNKGYLVNLEHVDGVRDGCVLIHGDAAHHQPHPEERLPGGADQLCQRGGTMNVVPSIPRVLTALAEWGACLVYIQKYEKRLKGWRLWSVLGLFLVVQSLFL